MNAANPGGAVERFAVDFQQEHKGNWMHNERLGGFCMILKREVLAKFGPALDEWSEFGPVRCRYPTFLGLERLPPTFRRF